MLKRVIEISSSPAYLSVRNGQLLVDSRNQDGSVRTIIPCEDIAILLVDNPACVYTHQALIRLLEKDAVIILCSRDHLPLGLVLQFPNHSEVVWRINEQISATRPLRKRLWKQIVQAKIRAQARNLDSNCPQRRLLLNLIEEVRSGDTTNVEAQAAKVYWPAWMPDISFRRDPDSHDPLNSMLNYGYAIVRAAIARALVAAGLLPMLGIHHSNRANAFCLADDLLEPLRPLVEAKVRELYRSEVRSLDHRAKAGLLEILTLTVRTADQTGPLMVALHRMVASLVRCYQKTAKQLDIPAALE